MAKTVKKTVRKKKRERKNIEKGQAHIQSTFNNTLVTLTDMSGNALKMCIRDRVTRLKRRATRWL